MKRFGMISRKDTWKLYGLGQNNYAAVFNHV